MFQIFTGGRTSPNPLAVPPDNPEPEIRPFLSWHSPSTPRDRGIPAVSGTRARGLIQDRHIMEGFLGDRSPSPVRARGGVPGVRGLRYGDPVSVVRVGQKVATPRATQGSLPSVEFAMPNFPHDGSEEQSRETDSLGSVGTLLVLGGLVWALVHS